MKDLKIQLIIKSMLGALIGIAICLILYAFGFYDNNLIDNKPFVLAQFIGSALLGVICMGGSVVYAIDKLSLTVVTIIHYAMALVAFICACIFLEWFPISILPLVLLVYTAVYFLIWLINYLIYKNEIRRINSELDEMKSKEGDDDE